MNEAEKLLEIRKFIRAVSEGSARTARFLRDSKIHLAVPERCYPFAASALGAVNSAKWAPKLNSGRWHRCGKLHEPRPSQPLQAVALTMDMTIGRRARRELAESELPG
jgi:hypothetical protein